jgi:hypothetical protein
MAADGLFARKARIVGGHGVPAYRPLRPPPLSAIARLRASCGLHLPRVHRMNIHLGLAPIVSLLAGILILVVPRLLNYIVAAYLIVIGIIGLTGAGAMHL